MNDEKEQGNQNEYEMESNENIEQFLNKLKNLFDSGKEKKDSKTEKMKEEEMEHQEK